MSTNPPSRTSTPGSARAFTSQSTSAEDKLKSQTVGLVHLSEFRKRRADLLEGGPELEASDDGVTRSGSELADGAPEGIQANSIGKAFGKKKKLRKGASARGLLSFGAGLDDEPGDGDDKNDGRLAISAASGISTSSEPSLVEEEQMAFVKRKLAPNPVSTRPAPKIMTKARLAAEAVTREKLRKEFLEMQEKVKNTEIAIPFVFYDGSNIPGGTVRVKKGDHVWLFLERCRKVGAELGVSGTGPGGGSGLEGKKKEDSRKLWARVGVDDLMCVRGEVIIPQHYEFYYFLANRIPDPSQPARLLFDYVGTTQTTPVAEGGEVLPSRVVKREVVEGQDDDPILTKVVDRRWYEKNKHIYPASVWKEFKVGREFEEAAKGRRDAEGNAFFFS